MMFTKEVKPISKGAWFAAEELFKQFLFTLPKRYSVKLARENKRDFIQNVGITIDDAFKKAGKQKCK